MHMTAWAGKMNYLDLFMDILSYIHVTHPRKDMLEINICLFVHMIDLVCWIETFMHMTAWTGKMDRNYIFYQQIGHC